MTGRPLVSIVLPVYNATKYLSDSVQRLRALDYPSYEVVIVDDGSQDGTAAKARELTAGDARFEVVELPENRGVARARRAGVEAAAGELVWFVDADDSWTTDALRVLVGMATERRADVVVAAAALVTRGGRRRAITPPVSAPVDGRTAFRMLMRGEITGHLWNKLFRREVLLRAEFTPARVQSDLALVADVLGHATTVAFTGVVIYTYVLHDGSIITSVPRRADSLALVHRRVSDTARRLGLQESNDLAYFTARYIALSGIKDALQAGYSKGEKKALISRNRALIHWISIRVSMRRRDLRRMLLIATAMTSLTAHSVLLKISDR
ncbi:glycosyltransferase family 2 protein [Microbacterium proteolyticum]|uniref:glycosyltransferase family 2 protein n=1 Tax=Microbacterium proteolyticum TaxID=1572644 RepID=UPI001FAE6403|nr:glycosyltransferase family 2 protein [Microbacterium proteolyticum]MCI9857111.1 glycosyltransferase family 2 protein [Microbacterium proteolyticum]